MLLIIQNIAGWVYAHWRAAVLGVAVFALSLTAFCVYRRVFNRPPKLDQTEIIKAQQAIAKGDREEMTKVLVQSDLREKAIDDSLVDASAQKMNAIAESRKTWADKSNDELAAELERRAQQP